MPNKVYLGNDNIIHQELGTDLNPDVLSADLPRLKELFAQLRSEGKKNCLIIDASQIHGASSATRKQGLKNLEQMDYDRIAIIGAKPYLRAVINFVLNASGHKNIRSFNSESSATKWLLETYK